MVKKILKLQSEIHVAWVGVNYMEASVRAWVGTSTLPKLNTVVGMRYSGIGTHGEMDCEHAQFHKELIDKRDARIRILPMVYCVGDPGCLPLEEQLKV